MCTTQATRPRMRSTPLSLRAEPQPAWRRPTIARTAPLLIVAALATWAITVWRMRGMDGVPGTDLGSLGWYGGVWLSMRAAMSLLSGLPVFHLLHKVAG